MILIEFLDVFPLENIGACFLEGVSKIVYIGSESAPGGRQKVKSIKNYLAMKGIEASAYYHRVAKNDIPSAVRVIERILDESGDEAVIDLSGGNETMLIACGAVWERRRAAGKSINIVTSSIQEGKVVFCRKGDCVMLSDNKFYGNSVEENAILHGGAVVGNGEIRPQLNDDVCKVMEKIWATAMQGRGVRKSSKSFPRRWNSFLSSIYSAGLVSNGNFFSLTKARQRLGNAYDECALWLGALEKNGIISLDLKNGGGFIGFSCVDGAERFFRKAGNLLELRIYDEAKKCGVFSDCATGVSLDWDGRKGETENEIDVFLMNGLVPIFISCKNGRVDDAELYKLSEVARRFGGKYSKKVIFISDYGGVSALSVSSLKRRAENMGIRVIDNVHLIGNAELSRIVKSLKD